MHCMPGGRIWFFVQANTQETPMSTLEMPADMPLPAHGDHADSNALIKPGLTRR